MYESDEILRKIEELSSQLHNIEWLLLPEFQTELEKANAKLDLIVERTDQITSYMDMEKRRRARAVVLRGIREIVHGWGFRLVGVSTNSAIVELAEFAVTDGWLVPGDVVDFVNSDLLVTTLWDDGTPHYITFEIAHSIGKSDVERARDNANVLWEIIKGDDATMGAVAGVVFSPEAEGTLQRDDEVDVLAYHIPAGDVL